MESSEKREAGKRKSSIGTEHFWGLDKMEQAYGSLALMGVSARLYRVWTWILPRSRQTTLV